EVDALDNSSGCDRDHSCRRDVGSAGKIRGHFERPGGDVIASGLDFQSIAPGLVGLTDAFENRAGSSAIVSLGYRHRVDAHTRSGYAVRRTNNTRYDSGWSSLKKEQREQSIFHVLLMVSRSETSEQPNVRLRSNQIVWGAATKNCHGAQAVFQKRVSEMF